MSTLTLPYTITAGEEENVNQVMSNFRRIETWANNDIDDTNMASGYSRSAVYTPERELFTMAFGNTGLTTTVVPFGPPTALSGCFRFDPADYAVSGRTTNLRLRVVLFVGGTAPTVNIIVGLYPITASGGASEPGVTFGTAATSCTFTTPAALSAGHTASEIAAPAVNTYAFGISGSGSQAANSYVGGTAQVMVYYS